MAQDAVLSLVMLSAVAMVAGAVFLWRRGVRRQAALMLVLAVVMIVNVLVWTVPGTDGAAPIHRAAEAPR